MLIGNKNEMDRACSTYGEKRDAYRGLVEKREGRRPLGRPKLRWENNININIKMDLKGVG